MNTALKVPTIHGTTAAQPIDLEYERRRRNAIARRKAIARRRAIIRRRLIIVALLAVTLLVLSVIISVSVKIHDYMKFGNQVTSEDTITWLESTDSEHYDDVKAQLADLIEDKTGLYPDKIAFKVGGGNYQTMLYTCKVWYKVGGHWFLKEFKWHTIKNFNQDLDDDLCRIYTGYNGDW